VGRNTDDIRRMAASTRRDPFKGKNEMAGVFRFGRRLTPAATAKAKPAPTPTEAAVDGSPAKDSSQES
jgi:hypothetical protein